KVLSISKLAAGGISAYTGGNAQTAITTAEVAVRNNALKLISRPLNNPAGAIVDHRANVVERDRADQFSADIRRDLGEPILLPDGKYGYVLESLRSKDNQYLYPVANDTRVGGSLDSWAKNAYTLYRTDKDNYSSEDALLRVYANDITAARNRIYPSDTASVSCYLDFCPSSFYNSNTDADIRLLRSFISPPNTGTLNVPGGLGDREKNPLRALFNSLINVGGQP
ncbi:MAG: VENN motif pre-toxin domain-containing protein, partial [Gallionella sp.]|nr:VENN motif pre-toxin domain-containing protein [Gallionella sp.]